MSIRPEAAACLSRLIVPSPYSIRRFMRQTPLSACQACMRVWLDAGQRVRRDLTGAVRAAGAGGTGGPWPCGVHEAAGDPSRSAPPVPGPLGRGVRAGAGHIGTIRRTPSPAHARHNALARRILTYPDTAGSGVRTFMRSHYARPIPSSACKAPRIFCSPMHM